MKKQSIATIAAILALSSGGDVAATPQEEKQQQSAARSPGMMLKIGVVDMKRVFAEFTKTREAEKAINEGKSVAKRELDEINAKLRQLITEWQKTDKIAKDPSISETLRLQKVKEANDLAAEAKHLERELAELRQRREKQLQEKLMRLRKGILAEIQTAVSDIARQQDYDIVFDRTGMGINGVPFLLHSKAAVDFSNTVLAALNPKTKGIAKKAPQR